MKKIILLLLLFTTTDLLARGGHGCSGASPACIESAYFLFGLCSALLVGAATWNDGLFISFASAALAFALWIILGKFMVMLVLLIVAYCLVMGTFFHDDKKNNNK